MDKLIARLGEAKGPDRDLDAEIAAACKLYGGQMPWVDGWKGEWRAINGLVHLLGDHGSHGNFRPTAYTASSESARTLLPDGWAAKVVFMPSGLGIAEAWNADDCRIQSSGTCESPAIALCVVALKARAALMTA